MMNEQEQKDYLDSLGLKKNAGYYILSEAQGKAVGFSPTQPDHIVIWNRTVNDGYVMGEYGKSLNSFEFIDLRFMGVDVDEIESILKAIEYDYREKHQEEFVNVEIEGHIGTWYEINRTEIDGNPYFLMEHESYGDEAACLIIDDKKNLVCEDVWDGFDEPQFLEYIQTLELKRTFNINSQIVSTPQNVRSTKIINLLAGPGAGKTGAAWSLAGYLKSQDFSVEYVPEKAKEYIWNGEFDKLKNQNLLYTEQKSRIDSLVGKVDYIVTDSPLILNTVYGETSSDFKDNVILEFEKYDNINIFLNRDVSKFFEQEGRIHSLDESQNLDTKIKLLLDKYDIEYLEATHSQVIPKIKELFNCDKQKPTVYVCSPLAGEIAENIRKAREYSKFVAEQGYTPIAPHITELFDDTIPKERELGLELGIDYLKKADSVCVFGNRISNGMANEIRIAQEELHIPVYHVGAPPYEIKPFDKSNFINTTQPQQKGVVHSIKERLDDAKNATANEPQKPQKQQNYERN